MFECWWVGKSGRKGYGWTFPSPVVLCNDIALEKNPDRKDDLALLRVAFEWSLVETAKTKKLSNAKLYTNWYSIEMHVKSFPSKLLGNWLLYTFKQQSFLYKLLYYRNCLNFDTGFLQTKLLCRYLTESVLYWTASENSNNCWFIINDVTLINLGLTSRRSKSFKSSSIIQLFY